MTTSNPKLADVQFNLKHPAHFIATGFGSGLLKPAPGTWGTLLAGVPIYCILVRLPDVYFWASIVLVTLLGFWACHKCEKDIGVHDHSSIVWDEVAGYLVTMALVTNFHWIWAAVGFAWFRFFDIVKPVPIKQVDQAIGGGVGVMLDDVVAGFYAMGMVYLSQRFYLEYILEM